MLSLLCKRHQYYQNDNARYETTHCIAECIAKRFLHCAACAFFIFLAYFTPPIQSIF